MYSVGVNHTSVNVGIQDSIKMRVLQQNPAVYVTVSVKTVSNATFGILRNTILKH